MEDNSILLAFCLIVFQIFTIIAFKKIENKNKKSLSYYEAIADEHLKKLYNPISSCITNIWGLLVAGFFLSNKELIIVFLFWNVLRAMDAKIKMLMSMIDILQLKSGLISMFPNFNAYFKSWDIEIEVRDWTNEPEETEKMLYYQINNKIVRYHTIDVTNLTENQINEKISWYEKRFKDYLRYIPKEIYLNNNIEEVQNDIDNWFVYLDDVRSNF